MTSDATETHTSPAGTREDVKSKRLVVGCVLFGLLVGLFVHYGATAGAHQPYPDNEDVATAYDSHVGETVQVSGVVKQSTANGTMAVVLRQFESFGRLTVWDADETAAPGGTIQVIGTLESDRTVTAERVLAVNARSWSELYKYAVSVVGAVLILATFFREWTVETGPFAFEVREDG